MTRFFTAFQGLCQSKVTVLLFSPYSLLDNNDLDSSKFKTFVEKKTNMTRSLEFAFRIVENMVGKEENAGYQHFLLFPQ